MKNSNGIVELIFVICMDYFKVFDQLFFRLGLNEFLSLSAVVTRITPVLVTSLIPEFCLILVTDRSGVSMVVFS